jgi:hypothetical protein
LDTPLPGNLPAAPTIPLSDTLRAAYVDLYSKLDDEYQNNQDTTAQEAIQPVRLNVRNILTKDDMYKFNQDTALFTALQSQITTTTDSLKTLITQIDATKSHFQTAADIIGAAQKVLGFLGVL